MIVAFDQLSTEQAYATMVQSVVPRPIAWVLSENPDGGFNLAPFSYFNAVCTEPPLIMFSTMAKPDGGSKDTRLNIERSGRFVVHIVSRDCTELMSQTSADFPYGVSEAASLDIALTEFDGFSLPRVAASDLAIACNMEMMQPIGTANQCMIFGRVDRMYLADRVVAEDARGRLKIRADLLDPVARLGGGEYGTFGDILTVQRPS